MLIRFDAEKVIAAHGHDPWGNVRTLTPAEQERVRIGVRFVRRCYVALWACLAASVAMIVWLAVTP